MSKINPLESCPWKSVLPHRARDILSFLGIASPQPSRRSELEGTSKNICSKTPFYKWVNWHPERRKSSLKSHSELVLESRLEHSLLIPNHAMWNDQFENLLGRFYTLAVFLQSLLWNMLSLGQESVAFPWFQFLKGWGDGRMRDSSFHPPSARLHSLSPSSSFSSLRAAGKSGKCRVRSCLYLKFWYFYHHSCFCINSEF